MKITLTRMGSLSALVLASVVASQPADAAIPDLRIGFCPAMEGQESHKCGASRVPPEAHPKVVAEVSETKSACCLTIWVPQF